MHLTLRLSSPDQPSFTAPTALPSAAWRASGTFGCAKLFQSVLGQAAPHGDKRPARDIWRKHSMHRLGRNGGRTAALALSLAMAGIPALAQDAAGPAGGLPLAGGSRQMETMSPEAFFRSTGGRLYIAQTTQDGGPSKAAVAWLASMLITGFWSLHRRNSRERRQASEACPMTGANSTRVGANAI
jgi:hypothetical protein